MKRGVNGPIISIKDKYSSIKARPPKELIRQATPPRKPKRRLVQGRRNPSPPAILAVSSPVERQPSLADSLNTELGVASVAIEEDAELKIQVLKYLNSCKVEELVELMNVSKDAAQTMINSRPFRNLHAARKVSNNAASKSGQKSSRALIGDKIVDTAMEMFQGYEAIDSLITQCEQLGEPLAREMCTWGFNIFGALKGGGIEMASLDDEIESQQDLGVDSPSSGANSSNGNGDIKAVFSSRRRANVYFLNQPDSIADDCVLKDYQVISLNWLALMYRQKLSGILADEMGLGKTAQVITLLSHLIETDHSGPHLVIYPGTTLENWLREIRRFSPGLVIEVYYGIFNISLWSTLLLIFFRSSERQSRGGGDDSGET
jgi:SWI/SNF-related matrix-associated actin-dependent regulator of chromatin subfamily A containing DEAD/H box 1